MSWILKARIAIAVMAIVVWGYAVKVDEPRLRLVGIIMLALALVLRFIQRRGNRTGPTAT